MLRVEVALVLTVASVPTNQSQYVVHPSSQAVPIAHLMWVPVALFLKVGAPAVSMDLPIWIAQKITMVPASLKLELVLLHVECVVGEGVVPTMLIEIAYEGHSHRECSVQHQAQWAPVAYPLHKTRSVLR